VTKIHHKYTNEPVCPHCGCAVRNPWDIDGLYEEDVVTELDCGACEKTFRSRCRTTYLFTTEPVDG
jgi:hypothetical protein